MLRSKLLYSNYCIASRIPDIVSRGAARLKRQSSQQRGSMGTNMRHVHFKPGLMADREHVAYFGPLMKLEEVTTLFEPVSCWYMLTCAPIKDSDQPAHLCSLI